MHAGTLAAVSQDGSRETSQNWARYWYQHPQFEVIDGLLFAGAHNGEDAIAVWERAAGKFKPVLDLALTDDEVLSELLAVADLLEMAVLLPEK
jgi:hypothetical protein